MEICRSYIFEFSISEDVKEKIIWEVAIGTVATHLCLALTVKELKINVEQDKMVTTLNTIKH
jgi:hypothetical protein